MVDQRSILILITFYLFVELPAIAQHKTVEGTFLTHGGKINSEFVNNELTMQTNQGISIIDIEGKVLSSGIKPVSSSLFGSGDLSIKKGVFFVENKQGKTILADVHGQRIGTLSFSKTSPFLSEDNTIVILHTGELAYINRKGEQIALLDKKYETLCGIGNSFSERDRFLAKKTLFKGDNFPPFSQEGLTSFEHFPTKKYGFTNEKFEEVIPAKYKQVGHFYDGLAAVQNEEHNWGFINAKGEEVIPFMYSLQPYNFHNGRAIVVSKERQYGYINKNNELVIPAKYQNCTHFYKGYALAQEKYGTPVQLIDSVGQVVAEFPKGIQYVDNHATASFDKRPLLDEINETLVQLVDHGKGIFKEGFSYGLIDKNGSVVLEFVYTYLGDFHNGKMLAHKYDFTDGNSQHTYGILDDAGNWVLELVESTF